MPAGPAVYSARSETVTIELEVFLKLLDNVYRASESEFSTTWLESIQEAIPASIEQIGTTLGPSD